MSWYDSDYRYRSAISIDNHGGTNTIEVTASIPTDWPQFWDVVLSSGNDVVVTLKDGITVSTFKLAAWDYAAKTGTIEIDNFAASTTAGALTCWLYWGKAGASSLQSAFTHSTTPKTGHIEVVTPGTGSSPVIACRPEAPGATEPRNEISKASTEDIFVWWDLSKVLSRRRVPYNKSHEEETIDNVRYLVQRGGSTVAAMSDDASIRQVGNMIRTTIKGGTSGQNSVAILTVITDAGRVLDFRCAIRVSDVTEPT
jgi:hypothetical protein